MQECMDIFAARPVASISYMNTMAQRMRRKSSS